MGVLEAVLPPEAAPGVPAATVMEIGEPGSSIFLSPPASTS